MMLMLYKSSSCVHSIIYTNRSIVIIRTCIKLSKTANCKFL